MTKRGATIVVMVMCVQYSALLMSPRATAGFPLSTEDTGTLGQGRSKIELTGEWSEERENGSQELALTQEISMVHGLADNFNVFFTLPYRGVRTEDTTGNNTTVQGIGDVKFGMKWRYLKHGGWGLGVKAVISAPSGEDAEKLGKGKSTQAINAIFSYETGPWEFDLDLGYKRNRNTLNQREQLGCMSAAVIRSLDSRWNLMADIGTARNKSKNSSQVPAYFGVGLSFAMTKDLSLDMGVKHGLNSVETDFGGLLGVKLRF